MAEPAQMRMTPSRRAILTELARACHPTADEIYRRVRRRLPRVSLGTVYRNLEVLQTSGLIRTLLDARGQRRYDARLDDHCHVRCEECGRVDDVRVLSERPLEESIEDDHGYEIRGHQLSFVGVCPECAPDAKGRDSSIDAGRPRPQRR